MNLNWPEAERRLTRNEGLAGLLICGEDAMKVALKRADAILAVAGPAAEADMRLTRIPAALLRAEPSRLGDAIREVGFFPGPRVAFVEDATDGLAETIGAALRDWRQGDAFILVTAGNLTKKSTLRSLFASHTAAGLVVLYDDPPSAQEIESELAKAGLSRIDPAALADLSTLARSLDPGDFRQTLEKIALYKHGDATPLTPAEIAALAPATIEAEVDSLIHAVAEGRLREIAGLLRRLEGQGTQAVGLCIAALRHFRILHAAASDPAGIGPAMDRARVNFKAKTAMARQVSHWGRARLETALSLLVETDLQLRSTSRAPGMAVMERTLIRLTMLRR